MPRQTLALPLSSSFSLSDDIGDKKWPFLITRHSKNEMARDQGREWVSGTQKETLIIISIFFSLRKASQPATHPAGQTKKRRNERREINYYFKRINKARKQKMIANDDDDVMKDEMKRKKGKNVFMLICNQQHGWLTGWVREWVAVEASWMNVSC